VVDISPDGAQMVYVANGQLYLRSMSELDAKAIQGTEAGQKVSGTPIAPQIQVVLNWFEELKALVPAAK